jgi:superfamily II DNA or RNA helicase/HKD family nuclease/diadenosine tetraphosphate (Ap4A) HIT family hydrolase
MISSSCPFCNPDLSQVFYEGNLVIALWDGFPVAPGHVLLIPKRHVATWFDATYEEQLELMATIDIARATILSRHKPDGFNVGVNIGKAAGQTIFHLHFHVIPRYEGDVEDPTGGVRGVIPAKGNYLKGVARTAEYEANRTSPQMYSNNLSLGHTRHLVCGGDDPLLPHLLAHLDGCVRADIAVAFVLESGINLLEEHLQDLLDRGGQIRLLTGDYLGITDPKALARLLDLREAATRQFDLRIFETHGISFHPKAYIFFESPDGGVAYVGSSNLSAQALGEGIEWNYRIIPLESRTGFQAVVQAFERLFSHPRTRSLDNDWIQRYERTRTPPCINIHIEDSAELMAEENQEGWGKPPFGMSPPEIIPEQPKAPPEPHKIQRCALDALEKTRAEGNQAGLVVLATGLGKTWLAAFDSVGFGAARVLFVAHREEILLQALKTFRRIRPLASLGLFNGSEKVPDADVLFASIQTLGRMDHLRRFRPEDFDYVVVDEFHHASARSYRKLIEYFQPGFLLGLTATPERTDGGDLLALCGENLVYRCELPEGIRNGLLCPFHYFGVSDKVDYRNIPWRSGRFDEEALTRHVATQKRAMNTFEQYQAHGGQRTLAFCCSHIHANFMMEFFSEQGVRAAAVHSGPQSAPRASTLRRLADGDVDVVFAVDMFNEGVDLPNVDTVMMLRPTESRILWLQQFGRGLRVSEGKDHLRVIDYIGNHRTFLKKVPMVLGCGQSDYELSMALDALQKGDVNLPPECEATYQLEAINILRALLRMPKPEEALRVWYEEFKESHAERPSAAEALHEGYSPRSVRKSYGSWPRFLDAMGDLFENERSVLEHARAGEFLDILEITPMARSFKMLTLLVMLNEDQLPGQVGIDSLVQGFAHIVRRSAKLKADVGVDIEDRRSLRQYLEKNPIEAWAGGKGTRQKPFFSYHDGIFQTTFDIRKDIRSVFQEMVREIAEWRLAEYLQRPSLNYPTENQIVCKVSHTGGRPILFLPDRQVQPNIPRGWTDVFVEGQLHEANFVKVAINVLRRKGSSKNVLSDILRGWYGDNAGLPGTSFQAIFRMTEDGLILEPVERNHPMI